MASNGRGNKRRDRRLDNKRVRAAQREALTTGRERRVLSSTEWGTLGVKGQADRGE